MYFFSKNKQNITFKPISLENAYLAILGDDLETASVIFQSLDSPRANWGKSLVGILMGYLERFPTYFEIRNFLEIDLDLLLKNEKIDYIEQILGSLKILSDINQETYKYIARVLIENKFYNAAEKYLDKAKATFYNDPELHFICANYYMQMKNFNLAKKSIESCLKILPNYYPAKCLKLEISNNLA